MKQLILLFWLLTFLSSCSLSDCGGEGVSSSSASSRRASDTTGGPALTDSQAFSLVNWNVQTFFDGVTEGCEYSDFKSAAKWTNSKYYTRLQRLCEVMALLNADIFVFEEIENEGILHDIANQFAGNSWDSSKNWTYCAFSKEKNSSIGCAVLSKFPLFGLKTHSLDIRSQKENQPSMRPLLEISISVKGREVRLLVNHWKSKAGGEEESQIWRDWQEANLCYRLGKVAEEGQLPCIICGDFNRDIREFCLVEDGSRTEGNIKLRGKQPVRIYSPWLTEGGGFSSEIGSYYYKGSWERIDHIFSFGRARIAAFSPRSQAPWANEDKTPFAYKIYNGSGYSDHLPVMANVVVE